MKRLPYEKEWDELTDWEQMKFAVSYIREMFGLSDAKMEHTWKGDDTPFDTGLWDRKLFEQQEVMVKEKKKARKKK